MLSSEAHWVEVIKVFKRLPFVPSLQLKHFACLNLIIGLFLIRFSVVIVKINLLGLNFLFVCKQLDFRGYLSK